jgi:hypothetical protein
MARIAKLLIADGGDFVSRSIASLALTFAGVPGHRHEGRTRPSDARTPWHPRGTPIANTRQVSIVSVEECALLAEALGLTNLDPALLGANVVLDGLDGLTRPAPGHSHTGLLRGNDLHHRAKCAMPPAGAQNRPGPRAPGAGIRLSETRDRTEGRGRPGRTRRHDRCRGRRQGDRAGVPGRTHCLGPEPCPGLIGPAGVHIRRGAG